MTTLITERLILRPLANSDAEAITGQIGNYAVSKNLARVPYPYVLSDALWFLDWVKSFDDKSLFVAINEKQEPDRLIGVISYEYAAKHDNAELGYWLAQPYWNQGYMREAACAVVNHAFDVSRLAVLVSCYFKDNPNSGRVLRRSGFVETGSCKQLSKAQNREVPVTNMQLTRDRWLQTKKAT